MAAFHVHTEMPVALVICRSVSAAAAALRRGVALVPGRLLSVSGERSPWIRMAFTLTPDDLTTAVKTLATV